MIGLLRGVLLEKNPPEILLEVNNIGYEVSMPMSSFYNLPEVGCETIIYTCFIVREDAQLLFGFTSKEAKFLFKELIKVNGIGPKMALAVLSTLSPEEFVAAVKKENIGSIVKVPGIGKKTAERLLIEIKDKILNWNFVVPNNNDKQQTNNIINTTDIDNNSKSVVMDIEVEDQAINGLIALGYKPQQASLYVHKYYKEGMKVEDIIKEALKSM
ncbi:MAG: Holliday junction branch migration protein RuvA [Succinivibrionaceae bacterium]